MKKFFITCLLLCSYLLTTANTNTAVSDRTQSSLRFTENRGQVTDTRGNARPDVLYTAENQGVKIFFRNDAVSYVFPQIETSNGESKVTALFRSDVEFVGANPNFRVVSENPVNGVSNYYLGNGKGVSGVKAFSKITYKNLYPNIDLVFFASGSANSQMKYEFVVRPGGKVEDIKLRYNGASKVGINRDGSLETVTPFGKLGEDAPYTYQAGNKTIASSYQLTNGVLTFSVADYDKNADLVIDPLTRPWATNYGGSLFDRAFGSGLDNAGNSVITGTTASVNFPTTPGSVQSTKNNSNDAFVTVFNADGTVRYSTYFGGNNTDQGNDAAFDNVGNVMVVGYTVSSDLLVGGGFQSTPGGAGDGFVLSLDANGGINWSSYWGGSAQDELRSLAVWPNNDIFTVGRTFSNNLQTIGGGNNGGRDVFAARVRTNGSLAWGTYFGGSGDDQGYAVAVDADGNMVATGSTTSANNIATPGAAQANLAGGSDAFVIKFNGQGARLWSTYWGGNGTDFGNGINTGNGNTIWVTGQTSSANMTTTNNGFQRTFGGVSDAFVAGMGANGNLTYSTYLGGQSSEQGYGIGFIGNKVYVTGTTNSPNFQIINPNADNTLPFQGTLGGNFDAFLTKIDIASGNRDWSLVYGGSSDDIARDLSVNQGGWIAIPGYTNSPNFPTRNRVSTTNPATGNDDAFLIYLRDDVSGCPAIMVNATSTNPTCAGNDGMIMVAMPTMGVAPFTYSINGGTFNTMNSFSGLRAGTYTVAVRDANGCTGTSSSVVLMQTNAANFSVSVMQSANLRCNGDKTQLTVNVAGGGVAPFSYQLNEGMPQIQNVFTNVGGGAYSVTVRDANNCVVTTSGMVMEPGVITFQALITDANCTTGQKASVTINATGGGTPPYQYSINGGMSFQSSNMFMNLDPMMISAVIRDANNCLSQVENKEIRSTGGVMVSNVATAEPTCGGLANGSITATVTSGTLPYTFSLNNGTSPMTVNAASYTFNGLPAGNYTLTVSDGLGCRDIRNILLNEPAPLNIAAISGLSPTSCTANNGTIVVSATGGTGELAYSMDGGVNFQMSNQFMNVRSGKYNIVVRDRGNMANSCQTMKMYDVVQANAPTILSVQKFDPVCSNTNFLNTGQITIKATGNATLLYYSIDNGDNWFPSSTGSYTFFNLSPANYVVRVAEAMNVTCASYQEVTLNAPDPIRISTGGIFTTQPVCGTPPVGGTITINAEGGTGIFEYSIDGGQTWSSSSTFTGLFPRPTNYVIVVRDANQVDCSYEHSEPVRMVNPSGLNLPTPLISNPTCGQNNGRITVSPTGGTLPRSYFLNNMSIPVDVNSNSSYTYTNLKEGVNVLRVQDAAGCVVEYSVDLQVIRTKITATTATSCNFPMTASTSATIKVDIEGGVGPYTYSIKGTNINGAVVTQLTIQDVPMFTSPAIRAKTYTFDPRTNSQQPILTPGMYVVEVRDQSNMNNCVTRDTVEIKALPSQAPGSYTVEVRNRTCSSVNGTGPGVDARIRITNLPATTDVFLVSDNGAVKSQSSLAATGTVDFNGLLAGNYYLYLRNANTGGCLFYHGMLRVTEPTPIVISEVRVTQPNCTTQPLGRIEVIATGGRLLQYSFNSGADWQTTNFRNNLDPTPFPALPTDFPAGSIRVREADLNSCVAIWNQPIDIVSTSALRIATQGAVVAAQCGTMPNGQQSVRIDNTTVGPYSFYVDGVLVATQAGVTYRYTTLAPGVRTLMVRDGNGCARVLTVTVPLSANPNNLTVANIVPSTNCFDGAIDLNLTGPWLAQNPSDMQISINGGGIFSNPSDFNTLEMLYLTNIPAGTYNIVLKRVTDPCVVTLKVVVPNNDPVNSRININDISFRNPTCPGTNDGRIDLSVTLTGATSAADVIQIIQVFPLTDPANRVVTEFSVANGTLVPTQQTYNLVASNLSAGTYRIRIIRGAAGAGCRINENLGFPNYPLLNVQLMNPANSGVVINNVAVTQPDCSVSSTGTVVVNATGGTGALEYTINNGASWQPSNTFTGVLPGTYARTTIQARQQGSLCNANVATSPTDVVVALPTGLVLTTNVTQPGCTNAGARGKIDATITGGAAPIKLYLNDALMQTFPTNLVNTYSFENLTPGTYVVKTVDARNCTFTRNIIINTGTSITINSTQTNPSACGASDGALNITLIGGDFSGLNTREYRLIANGVAGSWKSFNSTNIAVNVVEPSLSSGDYIIEARNTNDVCISTSIPFLLNDPNSATVSRVTSNPPNNLNCNNGSIVVTLGGVGAGNIRYEISKDRGLTWQASSPGGQTSPFFINLTEGDYFVRVRSGSAVPFCYRYHYVGALNCTFGQVKAENIVDNAVNFSVYPNPTKGQFSISYNSVANENVAVTLVDVTGRTIASYNFTAVEGDNAFDVDLSNHTSGIYSLRVTTANGVKAVKVVKE